MTAASAGANEEKLKKAGISYKHFNLYGFDHSAYMPDNELLLLKLLFDADGKILGAQAIGRGNVSKRIDILALAMQNGMHAAGLENAEFAYAPPVFGRQRRHQQSRLHGRQSSLRTRQNR